MAQNDYGDYQPIPYDYEQAPSLSGGGQLATAGPGVYTTDRGVTVSIGEPPPQEFQSGMDTWAYGSPADIRKSKFGYGSLTPAAPQTMKRTTTQRTIYAGEAPGVPEMPEFVAPEYDKRQVRAMTQKEAASGVRRLREAVQMAMGQRYENPNVKRMTLREALQGYGSGLGDVMSKAGQTAQARYTQQLQLEHDEALRNWQAAVDAEMAAYNAAWQDYLKSGETITETITGPA
jgi:hypothetical protein